MKPNRYLKKADAPTKAELNFAKRFGAMKNLIDTSSLLDNKESVKRSKPKK